MSEKCPSGGCTTERPRKESAFVVSGGSVATPEGLARAEVYVEDGRIAAVGTGPFARGAPVVDASGLLVLPGGVDQHVHLAMPAGDFATADDFKSGSLAALRGGTTALVDFVEPDPEESLVGALEKRRREAEGSVLDTHFHMTISEWREGSAEEMGDCVRLGVRSFKIYLAYLESIGIRDEIARKVLERARDLDATILVHAESGGAVSDLRDAFVRSGRLAPRYHALSRPPECEAAAIAKIVSMVRELGGPRMVIAHVSSELGMREIIAAKEEGLPVLAETCPHYLAFTALRYDAPAPEAARFVMSPPLRSASDLEFLWARVADGSVDFVSTDHCPFSSRDKAESSGDFSRIPNGVGGIAEREAYLLTEGHLRRGIPIERIVGALASNAAALHGMDGHSIAAGQRADLCLWRLGEEYEYSGGLGGSRCDYSIYEGMRFSAWPEKVFVGGVLMAEGWKLASSEGGD
jgi:dihydropyrimidinase